MDQVQKFLTKLFRGIGSTRSKAMLSLVERGEWGALQQLPKPDPSIYRYPDVLLRDNIASAIVSKAQFPGDAETRKSRALEKFYRAEELCYWTNRRIRAVIDGNTVGVYSHHTSVAVMDFINSWRKEVSRVLGNVPKRLSLKYSKGSTLSDQGKLVTIPDKMSSSITLYPETADIWNHTISGTKLDYLPRERIVVKANRLFTVPKNCEEDRLAAVEASASLSLQLAVGQTMRARYNTGYQVDLSNSQERHREMARIGSITGEIATIDLSSASDTVAYWLVKAVLPTDWFTLLNSLRAEYTDVFGKNIRLEKFSTMGNGFTFELETLLFRSLCAVLGSPDSSTSVYGDDIIVPTPFARSVLAALQYFGFEPNMKKTFCEGPFRESCGGDFFEGHPVRGHYMKELPDEPQHWVALANGLLRVDPSQKWTRAAWRFCIDQLPTAWRTFGPPQLGDLVLQKPDGEYASCGVRRNGELYYWAHVPIPYSIRVDKHFHGDVVLAAATFGVPETVSLRETVKGYRRKLLPVHGRAEPAEVIEIAYRKLWRPGWPRHFNP